MFNINREMRNEESMEEKQVGVVEMENIELENKQIALTRYTWSGREREGATCDVSFCCFSLLN